MRQDRLWRKKAREYVSNYCSLAGLISKLIIFNAYYIATILV